MTELFTKKDKEFYNQNTEFFDILRSCLSKRLPQYHQM